MICRSIFRRNSKRRRTHEMMIDRHFNQRNCFDANDEDEFISHCNADQRRQTKVVGREECLGKQLLNYNFCFPRNRRSKRQANEWNKLIHFRRWLTQRDVDFERPQRNFICHLFMFFFSVLFLFALSFRLKCETDRRQSAMNSISITSNANEFIYSNQSNSWRFSFRFFFLVWLVLWFIHWIINRNSLFSFFA